MSAQVVRRIRLPADHSSPAAARAGVRAVVAEVGMSEVLDEALLLATELATNAVVHANTDLDIEIVGESDSVTVTVMDFRTGPLTHRKWDTTTGARPVTELPERGRGLLLVDQLATCWGTLHHPAGKGVWFRLDRPDRKGREPTPSLRAPTFGALLDLAGEPAADDEPATPHEPGIPGGPRNGAEPGNPAEPRNGGRPGNGGGPGPTAPDAVELASLTLGSRLRDTSTLGATADELLRRLCPVIEVDTAAVLLDEGDGRGPRMVAAYGHQGLAGGHRSSVPLALTRPWQGELVWAASRRPYARPLAELTAERLTLLIENERLRRSNAERRTWLTYLAEASQLLAQSLDVELTLALIPRLVVPRLGQWCAVHSLDDTGELRLAAPAHPDESRVSGLREALQSVVGQLADALDVDTAVPLPAPVEGYAVPLVARGQQLGTLSVGRGGGHRHDAEQLAVVEDLAGRSALAIDNARIHAERRAVAEALQRSLLPPTLPKVVGIDLGAEYVPTGEGVDVGGDFYDVLSLADRRWLIVVGDVSGKGVHAAAVTGLVRDAMRVLVRDGRPLPEVLARLNETLVERGGGRFCTLVLAAVEPRAGSRLGVTLYLAGHDRPVLVAANGSTGLVGRCGTALGLLGRISSPRADLTLGPGDTLVFYTDGVTERRRGRELFGLQRLQREAAELAGFPAEVVAARLRATALGFSAEPPRDDIAIFALRNDTTG